MTEPTRQVRFVVWSITGIYWLGLFIATHIPATRLPKLGVSDRIPHFAAFAVLALLLLLSLRLNGLSQRAAAWWTIGICLAYGAIDEYLQIFVNRHCSFDDWFADAAGAVTVAALAIVAGAILDVRAG